MDQREFRVHALQSGILSFQLLEPLKLIDAETSVFGLPIVERRITDTDLSAKVFHLLTSLIATQDGYDL